MTKDGLPGAFFAYPSEPPSIAEVIRTAIHDINRTGHVLMKGWEDCKVGGKVVIQEICREIDEAEIFCADLTGMNPNVMFELGYAIARNRRIWSALDTTFVDSKTHFDQLRILTTVGYSKYCNSQELVHSFYKDEPYSDIDNTVFEMAIRPNLGPTVGEKVLYLKCRHETEASIRVSRLVDELKHGDVKIIVDDPKESTVQSLTWYGVQVYSSTAVICHLTGPERIGARLYNARYAFVSGMAFGMEKKLLMMAEGDFLAPIDYRDLLHHYRTAFEAEQHLHVWLNEFEKSRYTRSSAQQSFPSAVRLATELRGLQVGEYIAENEADRLVEEYFVETAPFRQALEASHAIFVGRKGSGKTANVLKVASELGKDKRNLVCVIKPIAYDLEGVISLLRRYKERDAKGYAIESLWKFLLYTEMANAAAIALEKISSSSLTADENELMQLLQQREGILCGDFTIRLQRCAEAMLATAASEGNPETFRLAISEVLHQGILRQLRGLLGKVLIRKKHIAIIIDNLDKAWDKQSDIGSLTEFLLGLLSAAARIPVEFRHQESRQPVTPVSLAVFLRSDIFYKLLSVAREPDKIVSSKIKWQDRELLLRIIEERFVASHEGRVQPAELWTRYFCPLVRGVSTNTYLCSRTLPRPRDVVFFVKAAVATAVNRGQSMVRESDILEAEKQYSQYALESILVENGITIPVLEGILYEFAGCHAHLREHDVIQMLTKASVAQTEHARIIEHLCSLSFLGLEVRPGDFRFAEDPPEHKRNIALARQSFPAEGGVGFMVHPAFWAFLEIIAD